MNGSLQDGDSAIPMQPITAGSPPIYDTSQAKGDPQERRFPTDLACLPDERCRVTTCSSSATGMQYHLRAMRHSTMKGSMRLMCTVQGLGRPATTRTGQRRPLPLMRAEGKQRPATERCVPC